MTFPGYFSMSPALHTFFLNSPFLSSTLTYFYCLLLTCPSLTYHNQLGYHWYPTIYYAALALPTEYCTTLVVSKPLPMEVEAILMCGKGPKDMPLLTYLAHLPPKEY